MPLNILRKAISFYLFMNFSVLDICLAKGKKRKLTQTTLFQLKCPAPATSKSETSSPSNSVWSSVNHAGPATSYVIQDCDPESFRSDLYTSSKESRALLVCSSSEDQCSITQCDGKDDTLYQTKMPTNNKILTLQELNQLSLETFIVGRRFSKEKEILLGTNITLLRDPTNAKDCNAIRVCILLSISNLYLSVTERDAK